jgi:hypothetical protein
VGRAERLASDFGFGRLGLAALANRGHQVEQGPKPRGHEKRGSHPRRKRQRQRDLQPQHLPRQIPHPQNQREPTTNQFGAVENEPDGQQPAPEPRQACDLSAL